MTPWIIRSALAGPELSSPHVEPALAEHAPSRLLIHLAGEFAEDVAQVWPAPHADFILAETPRRHLVCLALAILRQADVSPGPGFVAAALSGPLKRAIPALLPSAPAGLARALDHLGEEPWTAADYRLLLERLEEPAAAKLLRHAGQIDAQGVRTMSNLPTPLLEKGGAVLRLSEAQSRLIATCYKGLVARDGAEAAILKAKAWAKADSLKGLFDQVRLDLEPNPRPPFHPGTARLRPITTREQMQDAARRYRNCLGGRALNVNSHYYEWLGDPGVVIEIGPDPLWGWTLDEGRLADNAVVPADLQAMIAAEVEAMGVHVGRDVWSLRRSLETANTDDFKFDEEASEHSWAFGD